ncbi:MAG: hypothetical protein IT200_11135 [Thermoleophilia bacterium]|nr:hypothetical protein [Thermoleophilia bacterium]
MRGRALIAIAALLACAAPAAAVQVRGVDPTAEPIPGASFACYAEETGDDYAAPAFTIAIGPGRTYRMAAGSGTFTVDPSEILSVSFATGPLSGAAFPGAVRFDDWGQVLTFRAPSGGDHSCYQSGPRQRLALTQMRLRDPAEGTYTCAVDDGGAPAGTFVFLPGNTYRYAGTTGAYSADILGHQDDTFSILEFAGGALDGRIASYGQQEATGVRRLSLDTTPDVTCASLGAPAARQRFGSGRAPAPPRGAGGLTGMYAAYRVDVTGACGGLCWSFLTFTRRGAVYTREPRTGPSDAACARRLPNGLPVCATYTITGGRIRIGEETSAFARSGRNLRIGGLVYRPVRPARGQRLAGTFRSTTTILNPDGSGGVTASTTFGFTAGGRFTRTGFAGSTFSPLPGNPGAAVTTVANTGSAGTYRAVGPNTMEFRFAGGARSRVFFFIPEGSGTRPKLLRLGGSSYLPR